MRSQRSEVERSEVELHSPDCPNSRFPGQGYSMGFVQEVPGATRFDGGLAAKTFESLERIVHCNIIAITGPIKASTGPRYGMICGNAASRAQSNASDSWSCAMVRFFRAVPVIPNVDKKGRASVALPRSCSQRAVSVQIG